MQGKNCSGLCKDREAPVRHASSSDSASWVGRALGRLRHGSLVGDNSLSSSPKSGSCGTVAEGVLSVEVPAELSVEI